MQTASLRRAPSSRAQTDDLFDRFQSVGPTRRRRSRGLFFWDFTLGMAYTYKIFRGQMLSFVFSCGWNNIYLDDFH